MSLEQVLGFSEDNSEDLAYVALIYTAWLALFLLVRHGLCPKLSADGANRFVSLAHAALGVLLPALAIDFFALRANIGTTTTPRQLTALRVSLGYFVYDTLCCLAIELSTTGVDAATTAHHVVTMAGLAVGVFQRTSGHELLCCLLLMEVSSPCMHTRFLLKEANLEDTTFYAANSVAFAVTFLICRNILSLPIVYWTVVSEHTPVIVKACGLGILFVSWFWTGKLLKMISRSLGPAKRRRKAA